MMILTPEEALDMINIICGRCRPLTYIYENMTGAEIGAFAAYGETVMAVNNDNLGRPENPVDWPDAHTVATRTRNRANSQQVREWEAEKTAIIEKILSDTQTGPRRKPSGIGFVEASDLCWIGK